MAEPLVSTDIHKSNDAQCRSELLCFGLSVSDPGRSLWAIAHRGLIAGQKESEGLRGGLGVRHGLAAALVLAVDHKVEEGSRLNTARLLARLRSARGRRPRRSGRSRADTWHNASTLSQRHLQNQLCCAAACAAA